MTETFEEEQKRIRIAAYGTENPTLEQISTSALKIIERGKREIKAMQVPYDYVNMDDGKFSKEKIRTGGVGGCLVALLYFENPERSGIMAHYSPMDIRECTEKLLELKEKNLPEKQQYARGVLLVKRESHASQYLESFIRHIFPEIKLEVKTYHLQLNDLEVTLDPPKAEWYTEQHGKNSFMMEQK